ncbi:unnamed protein product [Adineta ricciae]|uniref:Sfi1 spindle body domain-containing protein n=1 Tax=Adineta ricciae TaxID=249248 RepID=A0A813ZZL4_ADIRI|nr:unnamed protein product [Adineta ricciae]CAF1414487.1 unnamed protein product [Adineta ricciae]
MLDSQQKSSRPFRSITPRKKSVRFNITSPSPRIPSLINESDSASHRQHPLNVSYTIPSTTVNIDHVTNQSHMHHLHDRVEYIPTTRRNHLQITGEKILPQPQTLDELHQFMKVKAANLRKNMTHVTDTFIHASTHLNRIKDEQQTALKRPSRIPISVRHRSPSPPVVIYRKPQHRALDDLRWYCLARKFSILWQKHVFGYHLRRIKSFYERKLLNKYFYVWRETIQDDHIESIAIEFYHRCLLKTHFQIWLNFTSQTQKAIDHLNRKRLQNTWNMWKIQFNKRYVHQQQVQLATEQYHRQLAARFYYTWQVNTQQRRQEHEKHLRANYHYRIHSQRICFNAWLTYSDYRRKKNTHKKRVHEYYQKHLLEKIYRNWKQALTNKLLMQQHEHRLAQLQERVLMRWAFEQWKSHMNDLVDEQRMMHMAEQYSDQRIMRSAFVILQKYVAKRRMKQRLNWIAVQHRARMIQCVYYRVWKHRMEQRENILMFNEFQKADSFYNMKITIRYWFCWRRYVQDCREENAQLHAAATYHNSKLLRKYFHLLRANITVERHEQLLEKRADDHYCLRYLRLYYNYWKEQTRRYEEYQMNYRIAIVHEEKRMRERFFNLWLNRAHSRLIDNEQHIVAERHYIRSILVRAWLAWRQIIDDRHNEERSERIAVQFYYHNIERRVLHAWKLFVRHCHYMKQMYRESEQFYLQHRGRTVYSQWLNKARHRRRLMTIVNERYERQQRTLLRHYLRQWRNSVQEGKDDRRLLQYAQDHYDRSLKRKVLIAWNNEMIQQVMIDNENEIKLNKYKQRKDHLQLTSIYNRWKEVTVEHVRERFLLQRAQVFYVKSVLNKYFSQWKEQHHFDMRIKLLERQAIWFDRMRLMSRMYTQWKQSWHIEQRVHEQKHRALLFWALQLQKKCFLHWLIYFTERKRKKARYNEATHRRHDELVRNSLRQFLVYTDHTKLRRQALFIHQQVYLYHDRNALASKYFSKWRAFVKESLARKQLTQQFMKRKTTAVPITKNPLDLVKFDNSPPKITNRPRPRKPAFLSDSFSATTIDKRESDIRTINVRSPTSSPPRQPPPTIDHSLHSPFITVKQPLATPQDPFPSSPPAPILLPPSAFQIAHNEIRMPLSSRETTNARNPPILPHRPYSTQPTSTILLNKDNLLDVKQRLEIYLNNKARLKRLRQQLANLPSSEIDTKLEQECQQLSTFIASEKLHLTSVLQNL